MSQRLWVIAKIEIDKRKKILRHIEHFLEEIKHENGFREDHPGKPWNCLETNGQIVLVTSSRSGFKLGLKKMQKSSFVLDF